MTSIGGRRATSRAAYPYRDEKTATFRQQKALLLVMLFCLAGQAAQTETVAAIVFRQARRAVSVPSWPSSGFAEVLVQHVDYASRIANDASNI